MTYLATILLIVLGLLAILAAFSRRIIPKSLYLLIVIIAILALVAAVSFLMNLSSYTTYRQEQQIATITFQQTAPQQFFTTIEFPDETHQTFVLHGDEWQIDARILTWNALQQWLAIQPRYRLEKIWGRYQDTAQAKQNTSSVFNLTEDPGVDFWQLAYQYPRFFPFTEAIYGSATYLPMYDGASYNIRMTPTGLLAKPANLSAKQAIWMW